MKNLKGIIFYMIIIIVSIFCINYFYSNKGFLTVEYSNLKAKTYELNQLIENLNK